MRRLSTWWGIHKTARQVGRSGWTAVHISHHPGRPRYAYTVGFDETLGHPELIVCDLPARAAFKLFEDVFRGIRTGELWLEDRDYFETPRGVGVWRNVHEDRIYEELWLFFASHRRIVKTELDSGLRALQLVLPDPRGAFPWEPDFEKAQLSAQPPLHLSPNAEVAAGPAV